MLNRLITIIGKKSLVNMAKCTKFICAFVQVLQNVKNLYRENKTALYSMLKQLTQKNCILQNKSLPRAYTLYNIKSDIYEKM